MDKIHYAKPSPLAWTTWFVLMILALLLVSQDWSRRLADRYPRWRRLLNGDPPTAMGLAFWRD